MAELDRVPTQQQITIEQVTIEESTLTNLKTLNNRQGLIITDIGSLYIRRKELQDSLEEIEKMLERAEDDFKFTSSELKNALDTIDDQYPQARINLAEGTLQYQPGALTRRQLAEQQSQQAEDLKRNPA